MRLVERLLLVKVTLSETAQGWPAGRPNPEAMFHPGGLSKLSRVRSSEVEERSPLHH